MGGESYSSNNEKNNTYYKNVIVERKMIKKNWYRKENHKIILIKEKRINGGGKLNDLDGKGCGKKAEIHNSQRCRLFKWDCACALFSMGKTSIKIVCWKIRWVELTTGNRMYDSSRHLMRGWWCWFLFVIRRSILHSRIVQLARSESDRPEDSWSGWNSFFCLPPNEERKPSAY